MTLYDDEATRWLCVNTHVYIYVYNDLWWWVVMRTRWWLHSTMGPYGRPVIEVAYGEMILSLHRGCVRDDSSGKVVGVSAWSITHVRYTWVNTSVDSVYIILWFSKYKNPCICILFSKSIYGIKEHWWSLTLSWPDEIQRMFSTAYEFSK